MRRLPGEHSFVLSGLKSKKPAEAVNHRVLFDETADTITVHRVRDRKDAYQ